MSFVQVDYLPFLFLALSAFVFSPKRARLGVLLVASLAFYAYRTPLHLILLLISAALDYAVGLGLSRTEDDRERKRWLACSLIGNLGLLAVFKYAGLFVDLAGGMRASLGGPDLSFDGFVLPLGISFYTFQTISYSFDVYRRRIDACRNPFEYALFVSFFPQLVAGPIERAGHLLPQLRALRMPTLEDFSIASRLFAWGYMKKTVLADRFRMFAWPAFEQPEVYGSASLVLAATVMLVVLYLDFSAYTDMARGSARLFGIELVKNFDRPFLSTSISQLWSRWHMSLTSWIADYVYSPLASRGPTHFLIWRTNLIALGLFGLWHGASWKFLLWGLLNGALVAAYQSARLHGMFASRSNSRSKLRVLRNWTATMLASIVMIVFFFAPSLEVAVQFVSGMIPTRLPELGLPRAEVAACWGLLALGLFVHSAGAWLDLNLFWKRIGIVGRIAYLTALAVFALRYQLPSAREFVYFEF